MLAFDALVVLALRGITVVRLGLALQLIPIHALALVAV